MRVALALMLFCTVADARAPRFRRPSIRVPTIRSTLGKAMPSLGARATAFTLTVGASSVTTSSGAAVAFARNSSGLCDNGSGGLSALGVDAPCILSGTLRVEPGVTNYVTSSDDLGFGFPTSASVTGNSIAGPTGATIADTLTSSGANGRLTLNNLGASAGEKWTASAYVKSKTVVTASVATISLYDGVSEACLNTNAVISSSTWTRIYVSCTITSGRQLGIIVYPGTKGIDTNGDAIYVAGRQVEKSTDYPSSLVPTAGVTASRVAETATFGSQGSWPNTSGVLRVSVSPFFVAPGVAGYLFDSRSGAAGGGGVALRVDATGAASCLTYDGSATRTAQTSVLTWTPGTAKELKCVWTSADLTVFVDGVSSATTTSGTGVPAGHATTVYLGSDNAGANQARGYLSNFCLSRVSTDC